MNAIAHYYDTYGLTDTADAVWRAREARQDALNRANFINNLPRGYANDRTCNTPNPQR